MLRAHLFMLTCTAILMGIAAPQPALAALLEVGPDRLYKTPSAASAIARDGDTIDIAPGEYYDCTIWHANHLTIVGSGPGVVITDTTCQGKAIFVVTGDDTTIRNVTLTRARVPDRNGAGIRAEGKGLVVQDSRFINNESGILVSDYPGSFISIINDDFIANGKCEDSCVPALRVGRVAVLKIEHSRFSGTKYADHILSDAVWTELTDNDIKDGPEGTSAFLVELPNSGSLVMTGNRLEKGPHSSNPSTAIMLGGGGSKQATDEIRLSKNQFVNDTATSTAFVRNWTGIAIKDDDNMSQGSVVEVTSGGGFWHGIKQRISSAIQAVVHLKDALRVALGAFIHHLH